MEEQVAVVAAVWMIVRAVRPYLSALFQLARLPAVDGQGVWLLVYLAALFVVALESANTGESLTLSELLYTALGVTAAAIGTNEAVERTGERTGRRR